MGNRVTENVMNLPSLTFWLKVGVKWKTFTRKQKSKIWPRKFI